MLLELDETTSLEELLNHILPCADAYRHPEPEEAQYVERCIHCNVVSFIGAYCHSALLADIKLCESKFGVWYCGTCNYENRDYFQIFSINPI